MLQTTLDDIIIKTIRDEVKKEKTKIEVANELDVSYYMVKKHTKDIPTILNISKQLQHKIRKEIRKDFSKINDKYELISRNLIRIEVLAGILVAVAISMLIAYIWHSILIS